ncbi:MAG: methyltransferase domain-containing protein [Bacteroidetes bacterium]|nr:methyltransferase domain-containing protein [Bacteroidota bacterium]
MFYSILHTKFFLMIVKNIMKKYLNIGCGSRYHSAFENIDVNPAHPSIIKHNVKKGLPFPANSFEAVYHSHVLEHLPSEKGKAMLEECFKVLQPGGVIRIAVPDLEKMVRFYLSQLDQADLSQETHKVKYEWAILQLFDQVGRNEGGGNMLPFLSQYAKPYQSFLGEQIGLELDFALQHQTPGGIKQKLYLLKKQLQALLNKIPFMQYYQIGKFRLGGEVHYRMYDKLSLSILLLSCGFVEPKVCGALESSIANWSSFNLDAVDGKTIKPDSLFMEAKKP